IVARSASETQYLAVTKIVFSRALNREDDLGGRDVHHIETHLGVGDLLFTLPNNTEELLVTDLLPAKFGDVAGDGEVGAFQFLLDALQRSFTLDLLQVLPIHDRKAAGLLQVSDQNGLGLAAEPIHAI